MNWFWRTLSVFAVWIILELIVRWVAKKGIKTDFYGSVTRDVVKHLQEKHGVKVVQEPGWTHLGWIADPEREDYVVQKMESDGDWETVARVIYGSWLGYDANGRYRVLAENKTSKETKTIGEVGVYPMAGINASQIPPVPLIASAWKPFFKPGKYGSYINDHCLFQDGNGDWRLIGITGPGSGDYQREMYFAVGVGSDFPPSHCFEEDDPVGETGELAWAPDVVHDGDQYHLFWSPHKLHHMVSQDGIRWESHEIAMARPHYPFFRDAMIFQVATGQWLMYATGRGRWFSRIDIYQSFDLKRWQYIRPAVRATWGSEKNFVTGSMESPFLFQRKGHYYLSFTYNNESLFWGALLLQLKIFLNRKAYNNTLILNSRSPYAFGVYRGRKRTSNLIASIQAHAPVYLEQGGAWYLTTCGWPFASTLTAGEVAYASLEWDENE